MEIDNRKLLLTIVVITLVTLPVVTSTVGAFRVALSLMVLLFFPGYTLLAALFPGKASMNPVERIALSMAISFAVVPTLGLLMHYSPWGLDIKTVFIATTLFILMASAIAWYRNSRLAAVDRIAIRVRQPVPGWSRFSLIDKALSVGLSLVLVLLLGVLVYAAVVPNEGERFTEFFVLDAQGSTGHYPEKSSYGEPVSVMVGIISHENSPTGYRIEINVDGTRAGRVETGILAADEKWQKKVDFTPLQAGRGQKVEFWLYKLGEVQPYNKDSLHFVIDVTG